ncbi:MAG TPA: SLC13 family permease [Ramlibacter sp.]|nr:SLC13 family permease [Ramlibacter sp.]
MNPSAADLATWAVSALSIAGMLAHPWRVPEWCWPVGGALVLAVTGLLAPIEAVRAAASGWNVYLFIGGMMLLAELARVEGLFDHVAAHAVGWAGGSQARLFAIVYAIGTLVTIFMSNDATAVVLTPAVAAAARQARVRALPHLFACAFVANAASFALPISNPANLVIFRGDLPGLDRWLSAFGAASVAATLTTFVALAVLFRKDLRGPCGEAMPQPLRAGGRIAAVGVAATAIALLVSSARGWPLGAPAFVLACLSTAAAVTANRQAPARLVKGVSWGVLLLAAGLFVLVQALEGTGLLLQARILVDQTQGRVLAAAAGVVTALVCNVMNNLPAGMLAGAALSAAAAPPGLREAVAIGVDLGPNLTVMGSLSSVLWLVAVRREGEQVSAWRFAQVGLVATPLAMLAALVLL